jgi:4-nitrophenyl phosphatase
LTDLLAHWPKISGIISDLDGVTYRGDEPIESAVGVFQRWNDIGLPYAFVTNNSTKSAEEFSVKLNAMGIPADPARIVTTSAVAADRLRDLLQPRSRVMVIGSQALVRAVVDLTYEKLASAQTALLGGAHFIGTNPDPMLPMGGGSEPGAGAILKAIETASGVTPTIIGKPQPDLVTMALSILGTDRQSTFMLGDQIMTDIAAGQAAGLPTIRVRTGVIENDPLSISPDFDIESLECIPADAFSTAKEL